MAKRNARSETGTRIIFVDDVSLGGGSEAIEFLLCSSTQRHQAHELYGGFWIALAGSLGLGL